MGADENVERGMRQPGVAALIDAFPNWRRKGFALIASLSLRKGIDTFEIAEGLVVRRPSESEKDALGKIAALAFEKSTQLFWRNPFETTLVNDSDDKGRGRRVEDLDRASWRYALAEFGGESNMPAHMLSQASALVAVPLEIGFYFLGLGGLPQIMWGEALHRTLKEALFLDDPIVEVDERYLADLARTYREFCRFSEEGFDLRRSAASFHELRSIPVRSPLRVLGYFALLESVIAHKPDPKDPTDSLSRQVQGKMRLLNRRFDEGLPFSKFFSPDVSEDRLWKQLYAYRSELAHGAVPDFKATFRALRGAKEISDFMAMAISAVLRQVVREPTLLRDLRDC